MKIDPFKMCIRDRLHGVVDHFLIILLQLAAVLRGQSVQRRQQAADKFTAFHSLFLLVLWAVLRYKIVNFLHFLPFG